MPPGAITALSVRVAVDAGFAEIATHLKNGGSSGILELSKRQRENLVVLNSTEATLNAVLKLGPRSALAVKTVFASNSLVLVLLFAGLREETRVLATNANKREQKREQSRNTREQSRE